jgi:hypothetical protein
MTVEQTRRDVMGACGHRCGGRHGRNGPAVVGKGATGTGRAEDGIRHQEAAVRSGEGEGPVREAPGEPRREQLQRRRPTAECHHRAACLPRRRLGACLRDPTGALAEAIVRDFGSLVRWKAEFAATGKALGGGSGWVLLSYSPHDKRLINTWAADHTMTLADGRPILALDMYEHAYHMDYGVRAAPYVDAFMQNIRWANTAALFERYSRET